MRIELVFVPMPEMGHLISMVEFAKKITVLDDRFFVSVLIPSPPFAAVKELPSVASSANIRAVNLPEIDSAALHELSPEACYSALALLLKPQVENAVIVDFLNSTESNSPKPVGLVMDMAFIPLIDVAKKLGLASFIYFPSSAAMLGLMLHLPNLHQQRDAIESKDFPDELCIPGFVDSVPLNVLPTSIRETGKEGYKWMLNQAQNLKDSTHQGIVVNTLPELEPGILDLIEKHGYPPIYPVGPLLNMQGNTQTQPAKSTIVKWLDGQPPKSVLFLCFGSRVAFGATQVHEIARALELSNHRFLWSLRRPSAGHKPPSDYENLNDVLPDGFLDQTAGRGLVCGWAPQALILGHPSIGGFVSHCGWNSILESVWCGVPIIAWPSFSEQDLNAYRLVKELGVAVRVKEDMNNGGDLVRKEELMRGIDAVMEGDGEVRSKVEEIGDKCKKAASGSSSISLKGLLDNMCTKISHRY